MAIDDPNQEFYDPFKEAVLSHREEILSLLKETAMEQGGIKSKKSSERLTIKKSDLFNKMVDEAIRSLIDTDGYDLYPEYFNEDEDTVSREKVASAIKEDSEKITQRIIEENPNLLGSGLFDEQLAAVAQGTEQGTSKPLAAGSNPASGAIPGKIIYVDDLASVPQGEVAVWGANLQNYRTGTSTPGAGQAEAAVGRDNWIGIPTKRTAGEFLQDQDLKVRQFSELMDKQLKRIEATLASGKDVYFPSKGIGTGRARLRESAPAIYERLNSRLSALGIDNSGATATETAPQSPAGGAIPETAVAPKIPQNFSGEPTNGAERVARLLNEFAKMREAAARRSRFSGYTLVNRFNKSANQTLVREQIARASGSHAAINGKDYSSGRPVDGIDQTRTVAARIADVAAKLGVSIDDEFFDGKFVANQKQVADVFHEMFVAIRSLRASGVEIDPGMAEEISALAIEMSRVLHDFGTPVDRARFQKLFKRSSGKGASKFGLIADAAEIIAQGVDIPEGTNVRMRRVAAARVGQVPQLSMGEEPTTHRTLRDELDDVSGVWDRQRYVDEFGLYGKGDDLAAIEIHGRIAHEGERDYKIREKTRGASAALDRFLTSEIGILADPVLDMRSHFDPSIKLTPLEARTEFAYPIQVRTDIKYRARQEGDTPEQTAEMRSIIDAAARASDATAGKLMSIDFGEGMTLRMPQVYVDMMTKRTASWEAAYKSISEKHGKEFADAYMASEEGVGRFGEKPGEIKTEIKVDGVMVMPEEAFTQIVAANEGVIKKSMTFRLPREFSIRFEPVVRSKYQVLNNGSVVSNRSTEQGVIQHRKIHAVKIQKVSKGSAKEATVLKGRAVEVSPFVLDISGGLRERRQLQVSKTDFIYAEPLDFVQTSATDSGQRWDKEYADSIERKFLEVFGAEGQGFDYSGYQEGKGFNTTIESSGALIEAMIENIRTDAYRGLEILAMNGDVSPELEAELINAILEVGDFRADRAPEYVRTRGDVLEPTTKGPRTTIVKPDGSQREVEGFGSISGRRLSRSEAYALPVSIRTMTGITAGDMADILHNPEVFGVEPRGGVSSGEISAASIVRGLRLLQKMAEVASRQIAYGGINQGSIQAGDYTISRKPFWMLADDEVFKESSAAIGPLAVAEAGLPGLKSNAIITGGEETASAVRVIQETTRAAMLAARAAVEVSRGLLGKDWSIDLDPRLHRHTFPVKIDTARKGADGELYQFIRLMESIGQKYEVSARSTGGALALMKDSGALSSKADKFFVDLSKTGLDIGSATLPTVDAGKRGVGVGETGAPLKVEKDYAGGLLKLYWDQNTGWTVSRDPQASGIAFGDLSEEERSIVADGILKKISSEPDGTFVIPSKTEEKTFKAGIVDALLTRADVKAIAEADQMKAFSELRKAVGFKPVAPEGSIKIIKLDGSTETLTEEEFIKRVYESKRKRKSGVTEGPWAGSESDYSANVFDDYAFTDMPIDPDVPQDTSSVKVRRGFGNLPYKIAIQAALKLPGTDPEAAKARLSEILNDFRGEIGDVSGRKSVESLFRAFWKHFSELTMGRDYVRTRELVRAIGSNLPDSYVEKALVPNMDVEGEPGFGIVSRTVTNVGTEEAPIQKASPEEVITVTSKNKKVVNAELVMPVLEQMRKTLVRGDEEIARIMYSHFLDYFGVDSKERKTVKIGDRDVLQLPRLESGPNTRLVEMMIESVRTGEIKTVDTGPIEDFSVSKAGMTPQGEAITPAVSATGRPKDTSAPGLGDNYDDYDPSVWEDMGMPPDETDISMSVRHGKLLGMLEPDRLLPRFGPRTRSFDMGLRTVRGGTAASLAMDLGSLAFGGNLNFENAAFSGAMNAAQAATQLLTKSPLKSTVLGSAIGLGATAATSGDVGRALFNIAGSIGGGILGGIASGGIGSFGGSMAGSLVADEFWKAMFNHGSDSWDVQRVKPIKPIEPITPDIKVRVP